MSKETRLIKYTNEFVYSKYIELVQPRLNDIESWIHLGYSMEQIANELGLSNSLFWYMRYKQCYPDLCDIFEQEKMLIDNVKTSLYRKAVGYYVTEDTAIKIKVEYINKQGKKGVREEVKVVPLRKYIAPDVQAMKFYLCNKDCEHWKDNASASNSQDTEGELIANAKNLLIKVKKSIDDGDIQ